MYLHVSIKIHESLEMYDFQNIEFAQSHLKLGRREFHGASHGPSPRSKLIILLRSTFQEVSKACIDWHDHVGCYAKKKNNKTHKLYDFLGFQESLEIF